MSGLSFQSARVVYGRKTAVSLGPLAFPAGQVTALLGANGSGKSSLMRALIGAGPGEVEGLRIRNDAVSALSRMERARRIAFLAQDRIGPGLATVRDVLALGRHPYGGADGAGRIDIVAERLALSDLLDARFGTLSGGQQARVLLGRALVVDAPVLLADEPTASLDAAFALKIMAELREEAEAGRTVIVSCHDLPLARRYCDRALVMKNGEAVAHGPIREVLNARVLSEAFGLREGQEGFEVVT